MSRLPAGPRRYLHHVRSPGLRKHLPNSINPEGAITGYYYDANFVDHGFLRAPDGTFTTFDPPGSGNGTNPSGINPAGAITGSYKDANFVFHGFLRARNGTFTTIDPPGAARHHRQRDQPGGRDHGNYCDAIICHGFLRARDGTFTTFDPPGSKFTNANAINPAGAIAGTYQTVTHGYLRSRDGTFTTVDPPGSCLPGTFLASTRRGRSQDRLSTQAPWSTASSGAPDIPGQRMSTTENL